MRSGSTPEREGRVAGPGEDERWALVRELSDPAGGRALRCTRERLPVGRRAHPTRARLRGEELVYVLAGRPTLRWVLPDGSPGEATLAPGDLAVFPAGTGVAHTLRNDTDQEVELLRVAERPAGESWSWPEDPWLQAWTEELSPALRWPGHRPALTAAWPAWRVETDRLVLRPWEPRETGALLELQTRHQRHLAEHLPWARTLPTLDTLLETVSGFLAEFATGKDLVYGVFLPDGTPIGSCGLHPRIGPEGQEIGYWLAEDHLGRGYATEAAGAMARLALEGQRRQVVEIHCDPRNERSARVAARLGFACVATLPGRLSDALGRPRDTQVWSLGAAAYPSSAAREVRVVARDAVGRRLI